jgi:hypothetical protein
MHIYYVYAYLRANRTPYYIGKGKGKRAYDDHGKLPVPQDKSQIVFIFENLLEQDAFELERLLIKFHGRKDLGTGILRNMTDGGEGSSGYIFTEDDKLKMSLSHKGKLTCRKGIPLSEEHKQNLRKPKSIKRPKRKSHSLETKQIISDKKKGKSSLLKNRKQSEEHIAKLSVIRKGLLKGKIYKKRQYKKRYVEITQSAQ